MEDLEKRASAEKRKLTRLMKNSGVPDSTRKMLDNTVKNVAWMTAKLDDARETIGDSGVAIGDEDGNPKNNPLYAGYENLWKSYMGGMNQILAAMPKAAAKQVEKEPKPQTVLKLIQGRRQA